MPNWCDCELEIKGEEAELRRFMEFATGRNRQGEISVLDHNRFIPYPTEYEEQDKKAEELSKGIRDMSDEERAEYLKTNNYPVDGYNSGGYEWCIATWGTKWGICHPKIVKDIWRFSIKKSVLYGFDCAWSPPIPLIAKMGEMFPTLKFILKYYEQGVGFSGKMVIEKGVIVSDNTYKYRGGRGG